MQKIYNIQQKIKQSSFLLDGWYILGLVILIGISFYSALNNEFVLWDDQFYVTDNPLIQQPSLESFKALWSKVISLNYHPLTMLSLWLNAFFSGTADAFPFIATNIFIHALTTIFVFLFIKKLSNGKNEVAFITAMVFGIHPMHVESVVWVSERKDVLYGLFFMMAAFSYLNYLTSSKIKHYWFSFLLFLLACLSKAMAVALVPVLLLLDFLKRKDKKELKLLVEKIPFVIVGLLIGWVAINVQAGGDFYGWLERTDDVKALSQSMNFNWWEKFGVVSYGLFFYLEKFLFPFNLAALHPYEGVINQSYFSYLPLVGIAFMALLLFSFFKKPKLAFGLGFFLGTVLLVLQFIPVGVAVVAERYTYLPYIGLGYLLGEILLKTISEKGRGVSLLLIAVYMTTLTQQQVKVWQNTNNLFTNVVATYPNNSYAREYLATALWAEGKLDSAIFHLEYAINELGYLNSKSFEQLAICWDDNNQPEKALAFFDEAIALDSTNFTALYHRSLTLLSFDPEAALADLIKCENSNSERIKQLIHEPKARCFASIGEYDKAVYHFSKAIEFGANEEEIKLMHFNRGVTFERMKNYQNAMKDYDTALQIDSQFRDAKKRIAYLKRKIDS